MQSVNPYVSTTGVPGWQGVGPMIYTQRTLADQEPGAMVRATPEASAAHRSENERALDDFAHKFKGLFDGWRTRVEKFTLDSRTAQGAQSTPADFMVALPQSMANQWCRQIHLGDIQFDGGEMFIEKDWSRWAFDESFCADWQNRLLKIEFPRDDSGGHTYEVWMPQSTTPVLNIERVGTSDEVVIQFGDVVMTSPSALLALWGSFGGQITISGCACAQSGEIILNQNTVQYIVSDGDLTVWRVKFYDFDAMNIVLPYVPPAVDYNSYPFGNLLISNIPSPQLVGTVVTTLIQGALPYTVQGDVAVPSLSSSRQWQLSITYNDQTDVATINYSAAPQIIRHIGYPTLNSSLLSFFGFNSSVDLQSSFEAQQYIKEQIVSNTVLLSTKVTVNSSQPRPRLVNTGTRIPVGNPPKGCGNVTYKASQALVGWIEEAMNGTWFGAVGEEVDSVAATPFTVTFVNGQTNAQVTATVQAGRYTPAELAEKFNQDVPFVTATVVYGQDYVYQGIRFESRVPYLTFGIRFDTATIDPRRLGYDALFYNGQELYEPVKQADPYYPNLYFGCSLLRRPTQQHYQAVLDSVTNGMRVTPVAFRPRDGEVIGIDFNLRQVRVRFPIVHGVAANARVIVSRAGTSFAAGIVGFVIPPPALDEQRPGPFVGYVGQTGTFSLTQGFYGSREPRTMTISVGGTQAIDLLVGDTVTVVFTPPRSWGVDLMPAVAQTIQPSTVGCVPTYLSQFRPAFATLVTPERINPFPVQYVNLQITLDGGDMGQSQSYAVKESFDTPTRNQFSIVRSIGRLLVGHKRQDLTYDSFDRMYPITFMAHCVKVKKIGVRVVRPDGSLYNFHGNPFSVTLCFTMVEQPDNKK